jgi:hypothetical protein
LTTSATVPSATSGSSASSLGCVGVEHAALAQLGAQRQQHVEHHADAGDRLALEVAARLVRVDDHAPVRQLRAGQVVVGHQHLQAQRVARRPRRRRWRCRCPR